MLRNGQIDETGLVARAVSTLRINLPPAWRAEIADAPGRHDPVLTISNGTTNTATFTVEAKSTTRASAGQVVRQLSDMAEASPHPLVFVTEYLTSSPRLKDSVA